MNADKFLKQYMLAFLCELTGVLLIAKFANFWVALGVFVWIWGNNRVWSCHLKELGILKSKV